MRPKVVDLSDAELIELASQELRDILGWQGRIPKWQGVIRWREAMPQYLVGHVARMRQLEQTLAPYPTLKVCGAGYAGVGIPQCVRGARKAAKEILTHLDKATCQCKSD
jgi:oxygen-dependent protoporphyrinogen oxidase